MKRILFGFFIAPLSSGLLQGAIMGNVAAIFYIYLIIGLPVSIIFGMPAFILFLKKGWLHFWLATLAGFSLGLLAGLIYAAIIGYDSFSLISLFKGMLLFGVHGFIVSLSFWLIAINGSQVLRFDGKRQDLTV